MRYWALCLLVCAAAQATLAQDTSPYEGKWTAKYTAANGNLAQADVVLKGNGGSWNRLGGGSRADVCVFGEALIAVETATEAELVFRVRKAEALAGCRDMKILLKRVDDKTLQGAFDGGRTLTLTR